MKDIKELREMIDCIDDKLVPLFEERMDVAKQVAEYKRVNGAPVLQSGREKQVLDRACDRLKDKSYSCEVRDFMLAVMDISKCVQMKSNPVKEQERIRKPFDANAKTGYQGTEGSFSEQAVSEFFRTTGKSKAYADFESVFKAIDKGEIDYGVVPLENSSIGSVVEVYDLLGKYDCYIVGEQWVKISHNLLAVKGATIDGIKKVYSKAEALAQSHDFLKNGDWSLIPYANTAVAAKMVADSNDKTVAAVASVRAAQLYGLDVLAKDINSDKDNYTRFIVISKYLADIDANKVTVSFTMSDEAGALYKVLRFFARFNVNMAKIESRPMKNCPGSYYFVIDLEGNCKSRDMAEALYFVAHSVKDFKLLGEYVRNDVQEKD